jgi:pyridoxamine 5'-phosphate oxidase
MFKVWFDEAMKTQPFEPNACSLATSGADGRPTCRMVLLKGMDERGYIFYTNYLSKKGRQIEVNPAGAMLFYWPGLERQVRLEGAIERLSAAESDAYFASRPIDARLGACVSKQSEVLNSRAELETAYADYTQALSGCEPSRPESWGGYRLVPERVEFWQGRKSRLHDRLVFEKEESGWSRVRLWP